MRINVYSQELTEEVVVIEKESNTGLTYSAVQIILHSSERLHLRGAVTCDLERAIGLRLHRLWVLVVGRGARRLLSGWRLRPHSIERGQK